MLFQKSLLIKLSLTLIIVIFCIALSYVSFTQLILSRQSNTLYVFAQRLGYVPANKIAEYKTCWDIFSPHCGQVLYFTVSLNRDVFQTQIDTLTLVKELPQDVSINTLLDINMVSDHILTIEEANNSLLVPEPLAYKWRITEGGENWIITFYEVALDKHIYKIDGQPIIGNIVTIMLQTK